MVAADTVHVHVDTVRRDHRELLSDRTGAVVAADLLQRTDTTVDAIACQVGYANAFALSVAFKRVHGARPSDLRANLTG